jgi:hypothetical protein
MPNETAAVKPQFEKTVAKDGTETVTLVKPPKAKAPEKAAGNDK